MKLWKKALAALGIFCLLFALANFDFFLQNIRYTLTPPKNSEILLPPPAAANRLVIASLGLNLPIVYVTESDEAAFQKALTQGVAHYPNTANPGTYGNCFIFGHSSNYIWDNGPYKTAFALLPRIKIGGGIFVSNSQGEVFNYVVTNSFAVKASDSKYLDQGNLEKKLLTLQTSYPVGTALARWVVLAELKE